MITNQNEVSRNVIDIGVVYIVFVRASHLQVCNPSAIINSAIAADENSAVATNFSYCQCYNSACIMRYTLVCIDYKEFSISCHMTFIEFRAKKMD